MNFDVESIEIGSPSLLAIDPSAEISIPSLSKKNLHTVVTSLYGSTLRKDFSTGNNGFARFFDILNSQGHRVFQGIERTPKDLLKKKDQSVFTISILDFKGVELIRVVGKIGEKYSIFQADQLWGGVESCIHHDQRDIFPVFFVKQGTKVKRGRNKSLSNDSSAKILYIVGEQYDDNVGCCGCKWKISAERLQRIHKERDFEGSIFLLDRRTCVGRVGRHWGTVDSLICDPSIVNDCYGVQFPYKADLRIKCVLLGAPFFLNSALFN
ncbi:Phospholipid scramblase 2 [Folsomia candida]|uniref:Phospholipid scramblase 2 n=1 Tax=Folsomia candida TaxID=158441 RepID=A0A226EE08_FOLCA|nr:Phospholipid scramblase 2 [Folsomia candida]